MFEWLKNEMSIIKTNRFHVVTSIAQDTAVLLAGLPPSYTNFVQEFGDARLYRCGSSYFIHVYDQPEPISLNDGEELLQFGWSSKYGHAYYKTADLRPGVEAPIFECDSDFGDSVVEYGADNFEMWLSRRCREARQTFSASEWKAVLRGPVPFSLDELEIVAARHQFHWEVIGINDEGEFEISVQNNSHRTLPYLSIGVKAGDGSLNGGAWLITSHILPGEQTIIRESFYPRLLKPHQITLFGLPDPEPEDRSRYWEFRSKSM